MKHTRKSAFAVVAAVLALAQLTACGTAESSSTPTSSSADTGSSAASSASSEEIIKEAAAAGKIGNWGLGNEYEIQALLTKYGLPTDYITQDFTMDQFDTDAVTLASAMSSDTLVSAVTSFPSAF